MTPRAAHSWPQEHNLNKLGRVPLDDSTYPKSRLKALWFLKLLSRKSIFSLCDLDMQQTKTIDQLLNRAIIRIIPAKFGQNPTSSLRGDFL